VPFRDRVLALGHPFRMETFTHDACPVLTSE
jgi:hypothetical protein